MATFRPTRLTDVDIAKIPPAESADRYIDPQPGSKVVLLVGKKSRSFGMFLRANNKQVWRTLGEFVPGHFGIASARQKALTLLVAHQQGVTAETDRPTLRMGFDKLAARHKRLGRQPRTITGYEYVIQHLSPDWWDKRLGDITRSEIVRHHERITQKNGPTSANNWARVLSSIFSEAMLHWEKEVQFNPALGRYKNPSRPREVNVTPELVASLTSAIDGIQNPWRKASWLIALYTGMRKGDIVAMQWQHVDLEARTLHIPEPKGGTSRRFDLPLCDQLVAALSDLPRLAGKQGKWVFPADSKTGHIDNLREEGLPGPHTMRHIWSTVAERNGLNEWQRATLLNQRTVAGAGINAVYTHSRALDLREEAQKVADALDALRAKPVVAI
jgi:integrase